MARCALELAFLQTFSAHEDIPGMQEPMVMGRGYESVGSSTKPGLAHRPSVRESGKDHWQESESFSGASATSTHKLTR